MTIVPHAKEKHRPTSVFLHHVMLWFYVACDRFMPRSLC